MTAVVWSEWFWLPPNRTWAEMHARPDVVYHGAMEVWAWPILFGVLSSILRVLFYDKYISGPLARILGIRVRNLSLPDNNSALESVYNKITLPSGALIQMSIPYYANVAEKLGLSTDYVVDWIDKRRNKAEIATFRRFSDSLFSFFCHTSCFIFSIRAVWGRPWLYDMTLCFEDYPHQSVEPYVWWLYMVALTCYWEQLIWQLISERTKQFTIEVSHHITTIILMSFSWTGGFSRMGTLFLLSHEGNDIPLILGKLSKYANYQRGTDVMFTIFVLYWITTRLVLYPFYILWECYFRMPPGTVSPAVQFEYCWAFALLIMNLIWSYMIAKIVYNTLVVGKPVNDVRDEYEDKNLKNPLKSKSN